MSFSPNMKRLLPYTVIPPEFYVPRTADRQLVANIEQMERPAYVLVARQMGKTNLLLHTKEVLENQGVAVIYLDLSTAFLDEREYFQGLIDRAIESHPQLFAEAQPKIDEIRKSNKSPSREHDAEIRTLLRSIDCKMVVILDEIDSLTNSDFSDRIFAHIRSVYFSRASFPELSRLTYVLSGVVEPNDIIKDKRISPFNIGEKIYLSDFTHEELNTFINKSGISLSDEETNRVYFWTAGNPRMVWDLCSAIEDRKNLGATGTLMVDNCVKELYLESFDQAPVDHIRQLVKDAPDIREAVWNVIRGDVTRVTTSSRIKLYLSGITREPGADGDIEIKNEVIRRSLSQEWLTEVAQDERSLFSFALERYQRKDYTGAIDAFKRYIETGIADSDESTLLSWYYMAESAHALGEYEKVEDYLSNADFPEDDKLSVRVALLRGVSAITRGDYNRAIEILDNVELNPADAHSWRARLNLGGAYLARGGEDDITKAEVIFNLLREAIYASKGNEKHEDLWVFCTYSQGLAAKRKGDVQKAIEYFKESLECAKKESKGAISLQLTAIEELGEEGLTIAVSLVDEIINGRLQPGAIDPERPLALLKSHFVDLFGYLIEHGEHKCADRLLDYSSQMSKIADGFAVLLRQGERVWRSDREWAAKAFHRALLLSGEDREMRFQALRLLNLAEPDEEREVEFLTLISDRPVEVSVLDFANLARSALFFINKEKFSEVLRVTDITERMRTLVSPEMKRNYIGFDCLRLMSLIACGQLEQAKTLRHDAIRFLKTLPSSPEETDVLFFAADDIRISREFLEKQASQHSVHSRVRDTFNLNNLVSNELKEKIGRNVKVDVRYKDGRVMERIKYKVVERDCEMGKCEVIKVWNDG